MICPEVSNFPPPKVVTSFNECEGLDAVNQTIKLNNFYKSIVVVCPDELHIPAAIEENLLDDNDYYQVNNCSVSEFLDSTFIQNFVKKGRLYCLSANRDCIIDNCFAITPDGVLKLHVLEYVYQVLGLEGTKCKHNFYEINIDLKNLRHVDKIKTSLSKLELFDFYISWEPNNENVCPSSIAKYFDDNGLHVSICQLNVTRLTPTLKEIPAVCDVDIEEMVEWVGMLCHDLCTDAKDTYISTYSQPDSENALQSSRLSLLTVKGFFNPVHVEEICKNLAAHVLSRDLPHYWASMSVQSWEDCPWRWSHSAPLVFQSHDSSCNIFFTKSGNKIFSIGQIKYS